MYKQNGNFKKNCEHLKIEEIKKYCTHVHKVSLYKEISHKVITRVLIDREMLIDTQMQFPIGFIHDIIYDLFYF